MLLREACWVNYTHCSKIHLTNIYIDMLLDMLERLDERCVKKNLTRKKSCTIISYKNLKIRNYIQIIKYCRELHFKK